MLNEFDFKWIELVFENGDYCVIPKEFILDIRFEDVKEKYTLNERGKLEEEKWINKGYIDISTEALDLHTNFYVNHEIQDESLTIRNYLTLYRDISIIEFKLQNGETLYFYPEWDNEDDFVNRYQGYENKI
jgi:hypothetical protein